MLHLIRSSAKETLRSLPPSQEAEGVEVQESPDSNAQGIFQWIRHYAAEMVMKNVKLGHLQLKACSMPPERLKS